MVLRRMLILLACALWVISCSSSDSPNDGVSSSRPVISDGIAVSYIQHDTLKLGKVTFISKKDASSYKWDVQDSTGKSVLKKGDITDKKEFTYTFDTQGVYTVIVSSSNGSFTHKGIVNIPKSQSFSIDLGSNHTIIGDINSGNLYVYGINNKGVLCVDALEVKSISTPALLEDYNKPFMVAAGKEHTLFVNDGYIYGCGDNSKGQLGLGEAVSYKDMPSVISGGSHNVGNALDKYVAAGGDLSVTAINYRDGKSAKVRLSSFGFNDNGYRFQPVSLTKEDPPARDHKFGVLLSVGNNFSLLRATGSYNAFSFGVNNLWQLGRVAGKTQDPDKYPNLNQTDMESNIIYTPYGEEMSHTPFPRTYFQNNYFGTLSSGDNFSISIKKEIKDDPEGSGSQWSDLNTYVLYVWGDNSQGQLGFNTISKDKFVRRPTALFNALSSIPAETDPNKVKPIQDEMIYSAAGKAHGLAVSKKGILYGWGNNDKHQLTDDGVSNKVNNKVFEIKNPIGVLSGYKQVWAGGDRSIALAGDNNLYTWGDNTQGILGVQNSAEYVSKPVKLMFDIRPVK